MAICVRLRRPILARIELMWLRTVPSAHIGGGGNLLVVEAAGDELGDFELAVSQAGKGCGPAGHVRLNAVPSKSMSSIALPSSTRLPSMTCANAGGMAATSVLIR